MVCQIPEADFFVESDLIHPIELSEKINVDFELKTKNEKSLTCSIKAVDDYLSKAFKLCDTNSLLWQISLAEIEEIVLKHPAVEDAVVVGVTNPHDGNDDRIPRAFVVLKPEFSNESCASEIRAFVDERVASYKKLRGGLFIISSLPKNKPNKMEDCDNLMLLAPAPAA